MNIQSRGADAAGRAVPTLPQTLRLLRAAPPDLGLLRALSGLPHASSLDIYAHHFPGLMDRRFEPPPQAVIPDLVAEISAHPYTVLRAPIDWAMDPFGDRTWRLGLQSLSWIDRASGTHGAPIWAVGDAIRAWTDANMRAQNCAELTWDEHAMAARLDRVWRFIRNWAHGTCALNQPSFTAAFDLILTHLYALADDKFYLKRHNHGLMQCKSLLTTAKGLPHLVHSRDFIEIAERRIREQVAGSVARDGVHIENSPGYQLFFVRLINGIIDDCYIAFSDPVPVYLCQMRDDLLSNLFDFIRSDMTLANFGDTLRKNVRRDLAGLRNSAAQGIAILPLIAQRLQYMTSEGRDGTPPAHCDRVFPLSGYACWRTGWELTAQGGDAVSVHVKAGRMSSIHSHNDEGSFQVFGFGQELLVDAGRFSNDRHHAMSRYAASDLAHNLLTVDNVKRRPDLVSGAITNHSGEDGKTPWLILGHDFYRKGGILSYRRLIAFFKPYSIVTLDAVATLFPRVLRTHLNFAPGLKMSGAPDGRSVSFSLLCGRGVQVETPDLGADFGLVGAGDSHGAWMFPQEYKAVPTTRLSIARSRSAGQHLLATHIRLVPKAPTTARRLSLLQTPGQVLLRLGHGPDVEQIGVPLDRLFPAIGDGQAGV